MAKAKTVTTRLSRATDLWVEHEARRTGRPKITIVASLVEEAAHDRLDDPSLLLLAAEESRILVAANVKDFVPIVQQWNAAGRQHAGRIFIPPHIRQDQFGRILTGIRAALDDVQEQAGWIDRIHYLR